MFSRSYHIYYDNVTANHHMIIHITLNHLDDRAPNRREDISVSICEYLQLEMLWNIIKN